MNTHNEALHGSQHYLTNLARNFAIMAKTSKVRCIGQRERGRYGKIYFYFDMKNPATYQDTSSDMIELMHGNSRIGHGVSSFLTMEKTSLHGLVATVHTLPVSHWWQNIDANKNVENVVTNWFFKSGKLHIHSTCNLKLESLCSAMGLDITTSRKPSEEKFTYKRAIAFDINTLDMLMNSILTLCIIPRKKTSE